MYRRPKFLEKLLEIRCEMALEADYDVDLFAEMARSGRRSVKPMRRPADRFRSDRPDKTDDDVDVSQLIESRDSQS